MSELRKDILSGRWVVLAVERMFRPQDCKVVHVSNGVEPSACPFCPGNEGMTPREILAVGTDGSTPGGRQWATRVVPNRYPALRVEGELSPRPDGIFDVMNGIGAHEVIVDTPVHSVQPHRYSDSDWARIVRVLQSRSLDLRRDIRLACLTIFKNHGSQAGATLSHPHTQIIATPVVPALIASEMMEISRYVAFRQRCPLCDMIVQETANGVRVVSANASFTVVAPFASRVPFELLVIPVRHSPDFDSISGDEVRDLGQILAGVFRQLAAAIGETAFNLVVHTAPLRNQGGSAAAQQDYHWHVEILPWVSGPAGFDACTGLFINTVAPEEAARYLRQLAERTER